MIRIALLAAVMAAASTTPAQAQETRDTARAKLDAEFAQRDTNKDGFLSAAELEAGLSRMKVGGKQIPAVNAKRLAALFLARADANKDGKVSEAESQSMMGAVFARYDINKDGRVDGQEAAAARAAAEGVAKGGAAKSGAAKPSR